MKRLSIIMLAMSLVLVFTGCGFKKFKGYYYDNTYFNYVKSSKFKNPEGTINHPYTFTEAQMSTILRMIEVKKGSAFSKDEDIKTVFDDYSTGKLTKPIITAFSEITPKERVAFAFIVKDPLFVLKNDRLTTGWMWVQDGKLHILFDKLYAKVTGDTNKRGYQSEKLLDMSKGLRVVFDLQPGQEFGNSTKELVIDPQMYIMIADERAKKEKELAEKGADNEVKIKVVKEKAAKDRLEELETLKKEKMITEQEYKAKKKEILKDL